MGSFLIQIYLKNENHPSYRILALDENRKRLSKGNTKIYYKSILEFRGSDNHGRACPDAYYDPSGLAVSGHSLSMGSIVCEPD